MTSCIGLFQQKYLSLVKGVKQQISYFSYFHPIIRTLCKNLHDHKLCIFTPIIFTRNQQIIKVKQKDHISIMYSVGLVFFLARACQHKTSKIGITIFALPQLKICILQDRNNLKALIQLNLISPRKISQTVGFIFLSNSKLHDEPNKFWFTQFGHSQLQL